MRTIHAGPSLVCDLVVLCLGFTEPSLGPARRQGLLVKVASVASQIKLVALEGILEGRTICSAVIFDLGSLF